MKILHSDVISVLALAVFTAEEQKEAYEISKKFVRWLPSNCSTCHEELKDLLRKDHEYQELWGRDNEYVKTTPSILKDCRTQFEKFRSMGKSRMIS